MKSVLFILWTLGFASTSSGNNWIRNTAFVASTSSRSERYNFGYNKAVTEAPTTKRRKSLILDGNHFMSPASCGLCTTCAGVDTNGNHKAKMCTRRSAPTFLTSLVVAIMLLFAGLNVHNQTPTNVANASTDIASTKRVSAVETHYATTTGTSSIGERRYLQKSYAPNEEQVEEALTKAGAAWYTPLILSTLAGMSTSLGAAVVFFLPKQKLSQKGQRVTIVSPEVMCFSLSLAGSVMVTISLISLLPQCFTLDMTAMQYFTRFTSIGLGCGLYKVLSWSFPDPEDIFWSESEGAGGGSGDTTPDEQELVQMVESTRALMAENESKGDSRALRRMPSSFQRKESKSDISNEVNPGADEQQQLLPDFFTSFRSSSASHSSIWTFRGSDLTTPDERKSWRIAMLLFFALLAHNFPEGLAVAASTAQSKDLGITVTVGIMIHNIPEGIAIAIPCMKARPNAPWLAFVLASVSGLAEPLGALITVAFLRYAQIGSVGAVDAAGTAAQSLITLEDVLAFVAGVMSMVAICELFPEARRHVKSPPLPISSSSNSGSDNKQGALRRDNSSNAVDTIAVASAQRVFYAGILSGFIIMVLTEWYLD